MDDERTFYLVKDTLVGAPLSDHLLHGYADRLDFRKALKNIIVRWGGRIGERVGERHGFLLLRFHDTPGGQPDEEWLPRFLLQQTEMPDYVREAEREPDPFELELDEAFGFD